MNDRFAKTPNPHYYAVIFTNQLSSNDEGYGAMADKLVEISKDQPGFLGIESTRDTTGLGITISYWKDEDSISAWKQNAKHLIAQKAGIERWYAHYELRVARIDRAYSGPNGRATPPT